MPSSAFPLIRLPFPAPPIFTLKPSANIPMPFPSAAFPNISVPIKQFSIVVLNAVLSIFIPAVLNLEIFSPLIVQFVALIPIPIPPLVKLVPSILIVGLVAVAPACVSPSIVVLRVIVGRFEPVILISCVVVLGISKVILVAFGLRFELVMACLNEAKPVLFH
ncbi:MAG: hypothetical protein EAY69_03105 [Cytophagales bacterium]|nr:MAG: hypothetical protein EAY69_03105 [Cytophagales bacterium]